MGLNEELYGFPSGALLEQDLLWEQRWTSLFVIRNNVRKRMRQEQNLDSLISHQKLCQDERI
jgi:hypothetical protein